MTGNFTLSAGAFLDIEIGGTTAGTQYDQLIVTGTVTLGGTLTSRLINGFNPATGATFTIIDNDGTDAVTGTFAGLSEGEFFTHNGSSYSISYQGGDGNDVVLTAANDAPVIAVAGNLDALVANPSATMSACSSATARAASPPPRRSASAPTRFRRARRRRRRWDLDAVANFNDNNVSLLIGNGAGGFTAGTAFSVGGAPIPSRLATSTATATSTPWSRTRIATMSACCSATARAASPLSGRSAVATDQVPSRSATSTATATSTLVTNELQQQQRERGAQRWRWRLQRRLSAGRRRWQRADLHRSRRRQQ